MFDIRLFTCSTTNDNISRGCRWN